MEFWEAYECTILVQMNFHLKTCSLITNKHSIAGKFVTASDAASDTASDTASDMDSDTASV